jgi:tetratricopeptide (TPR) repeat protein
MLLSLVGSVSCLGDPPPPAAPASACPSTQAASTAPSASSTPIASTSAAPPPSDAASKTSLGELTFPVTGSPECQRIFRDGMLALHSFLYDQAHERFVAALAADPSCAMAAWGDAMTFDHPIWHERDLPKARAALAKIAHEESLTPKERAYVATARDLYAKDDAKQGHAAWLAAAAKMHAQYTDDAEVALQHVLALLSVYGYDPTHVREQMEAGNIALDVLRRQPNHPGAAHYVIHSFDSPDHAILALDAARTYARIAPAGGHAQHMPSHTFVHLGMWREVVPSNERAWASSVEWEKSRGHSAGKYDWHSYSWLVDANLQLGHFTRARQLVDDARALVISTKDEYGAQIRGAYIDMVTDYVITTGRWSDVEALVAPVFAPVIDEGGAGGAVACASHAPAGGGEVRLPYALYARQSAEWLRAEAAIRAGDKKTAEARIADMRAVRAQIQPWMKMVAPSTGKRWDVREEALLARARASSTKNPAEQKSALDSLQRWVTSEDERGVAGPPFSEPPRETLGNAFLVAGKPKEALAMFERDLEQRPNRALALLGSARAAKASGDATLARTRYAVLLDQWNDADASVEALAEVRDGAK